MMKIKELLKEMIPVVLGVLIALFINNWNEGRKDRQYVAKMMDSIREELQENKESLADSITEHEQLVDTIDYYQNEAIPIGEFVGKVNGIRAVSIKNTAWKAMINSRMELLEYKEISTLTNIDEQKENMKMKLEKLIDLIYNRAGSTDYIDIGLFKVTIQDLLGVEVELLELHEEFLNPQEK